LAVETAAVRLGGQAPDNAHLHDMGYVDGIGIPVVVDLGGCEVVTGLVEVGVAVPRLMPAVR